MQNPGKPPWAVPLATGQLLSELVAQGAIQGDLSAEAFSALVSGAPRPHPPDPGHTHHSPLFSSGLDPLSSLHYRTLGRHPSVGGVALMPSSRHGMQRRGMYLSSPSSSTRQLGTGDINDAHLRGSGGAGPDAAVVRPDGRGFATSAPRRATREPVSACGGELQDVVDSWQSLSGSDRAVGVDRPREERGVTSCMKSAGTPWLPRGSQGSATCSQTTLGLARELGQLISSSAPVRNAAGPRHESALSKPGSTWRPQAPATMSSGSHFLGAPGASQGVPRPGMSATAMHDLLELHLAPKHGLASSRKPGGSSSSPAAGSAPRGVHGQSSSRAVFHAALRGGIGGPACPGGAIGASDNSRGFKRKAEGEASEDWSCRASALRGGRSVSHGPQRNGLAAHVTSECTDASESEVMVGQGLWQGRVSGGGQSQDKAVSSMTVTEAATETDALTMFEGDTLDTKEEKKLRRLAANREAARRMRKRHADRLLELQARVEELREVHERAVEQLEEAKARIAELEDANKQLEQGPPDPEAKSGTGVNSTSGSSHDASCLEVEKGSPIPEQEQEPGLELSGVEESPENTVAEGGRDCVPDSGEALASRLDFPPDAALEELFY